VRACNTTFCSGEDCMYLTFCLQQTTVAIKCECSWFPLVFRSLSFSIEGGLLDRLRNPLPKICVFLLWYRMSYALPSNFSRSSPGIDISMRHQKRRRGSGSWVSVTLWILPSDDSRHISCSTCSLRQRQSPRTYLFPCILYLQLNNGRQEFF